MMHDNARVARTKGALEPTMSINVFDSDSVAFGEPQAHLGIVLIRLLEAMKASRAQQRRRWATISHYSYGTMATDARRRLVGSEASSMHSNGGDMSSRPSWVTILTEDGSINDRQLEATQMQQIVSQYRLASAASAAQLQPSSPLCNNKAFQYVETQLVLPVQKFWRRQVCITVDHDACRDHLALERTFLGYLRTSLVFSTLGVTVAQLFRLQHVFKPNSVFGYFRLGTPLSIICQCFAIYTLLLGAFRTWRHQNAILRGKAITGGFEVMMLALGTLIIVVTFFVLLVAVDITKEDLKVKY